MRLHPFSILGVGLFCFGCSGPNDRSDDGGVSGDAIATDSPAMPMDGGGGDSGPPCTYSPITPAGAIDTSFTGGTVDVKPLNANVGAFDIGVSVVDSQHRVTVFGKAFYLANNGYEYRLASVRFTPDGKLDSGYGVAVNDNPQSVVEFAAPTFAAVDASDRIVIAGAANVSGNSATYVTRLDGSGMIDASFGTHPFAAATTIAALATDGTDVYVSVTSATANAKLLQRFHGDGTMDGAFQPQSQTTFSAIAFTTDCVLTSTSANEVRCLKRSDGSPSSSFGAAGVAMLPKTTLYTVDAFEIFPQPSGRIVVLRGEVYSKATEVLALTSSGAPDMAFASRKLGVYVGRGVEVCDHTIGGSSDLAGKLNLAHLDGLGQDVAPAVSLDTMGGSRANPPVFDRNGKAVVTAQMQTGSTQFAILRANPP